MGCVYDAAHYFISIPDKSVSFEMVRIFKLFGINRKTVFVVAILAWLYYLDYQWYTKNHKNILFFLIKKFGRMEKVLYLCTRKREINQSNAENNDFYGAVVQPG